MDNIVIPERWHAEVISLLGRGSYGSVYKIKYEDKIAVVKMINVPYDYQEEESLRNEFKDSLSIQEYCKNLVEDLISEVKAMMILKNNPNVVEIYDYEVVEKEVGFTIYILMEYLMDFKEYIMNHTFDEKLVLKLGIDIATALQQCEKEKIMHRDIKPENIMVTSNGTFKLGDFGIAKRIEDRTKTASLKGTFTYMAPEVYHGNLYDTRADQYSLGIVLFKLMNRNRDPFVDLEKKIIYYKDRQDALMMRMSNEPFPSPCDASEIFGLIIKKACAYNPEDRFKSISELKKTLTALYEGKTVHIQKNKIVRITQKAKLSIVIVCSLIALMIVGINTYTHSSSYIKRMNDKRELELSERLNKEAVLIDAKCLTKIDSKEPKNISNDKVLDMIRNEDQINYGKENQKYRESISGIIYQDLEVTVGYINRYNVSKNIYTDKSEVDQIIRYYTYVNNDGAYSITEGYPEEKLRKLLPKSYQSKLKEGRKYIQYDGLYWLNEHSVYQNAFNTDIVAIMENEDASVECLVVLRNGTDQERTLSWIGMELKSKTDTVFKVQLDGLDKQTAVSNDTLELFSIHIDKKYIKDIQWDKMDLSFSTYNSDHH